MHSFGGKIDFLEAMADSQAANKTIIELATNDYQVQTAKIEHFLKDNSRLKQQVQAFLSPACSPRQPATKRPSENSKEILD